MGKIVLLTPKSLAYYLQQSIESMDDCLNSKRKKLFAVLLLLQVIIISILIAAGEFSTAIGSTIFRIIFLVAANYCLQMNFAIFYSLFALLSALYLVDPIGLFLTGHGDRKSIAQNILCIVAFILTLIASYLGYLYAREIETESGSPGAGQNYGDSSPAFSRPINQPAGQAPQPTTSYGGTNYLFQNPTQNPTSNTRNTAQDQRRGFEAFSGQGYSLS